jgi:hypothetical protein
VSITGQAQNKVWAHALLKRGGSIWIVGDILRDMVDECQSFLLKKEMNIDQVTPSAHFYFLGNDHGVVYIMVQDADNIIISYSDFSDNATLETEISVSFTLLERSAVCGEMLLRSPEVIIGSISVG